MRCGIEKSTYCNVNEFWVSKILRTTDEELQSIAVVADDVALIPDKRVLFPGLRSVVIDDAVVYKVSIQQFQIPDGNFGYDVESAGCFLVTHPTMIPTCVGIVPKDRLLASEYVRTSLTEIVAMPPASPVQARPASLAQRSQQFQDLKASSWTRDQ